MAGKNVYKLLGIPDAIGVVLFTIALILTLAPYFPGEDFGIFKVPDLSDNMINIIQSLGPILLFISILLFIPIPGLLVGTSDNRQTKLVKISQSKAVMPDDEIRDRYRERRPVEFAIRLIPKKEFNENGLLGKKERKYVFVGDYEEQRYRSLDEILNNLWFGNRFDPEPDSNVEWVAIVFKVGDMRDHTYDLIPGTWKAIFRILSDPKRIGMFTANSDEVREMGPRKSPKRDYIIGDQDYWYNSISSKLESYDEGYNVLRKYFGISDTCFNGNGITGELTSLVKSRIFLIKNVQLSHLDYHIQDMGYPSDNLVLDIVI